tara:strand:- start:2324 stop:3403 length:1080 start_codon:yes stop_codon:yes gene_type:complete
MKICLIGQNLTNLVLASVLAKKKIDVVIYIDKSSINQTGRTIAISSDNYNYLKQYTNNKLSGWHSNEIKIYIESSQSKEIINFKQPNKKNFYLISYNEIYKILLNLSKKSKYIKFIEIKKPHHKLVEKIKNYGLVVNSENKNIITRKYFFNKIHKNYKSHAYTFLINHERIKNDIATQIFTKNGPLAFLPISNKQTSIVYSYLGPIKSESQILKSFNYYNSFYKVNNIGSIEKFTLNFSMLRKYTHGNILAFGDLIHRVHPIAGQGFNMTIRDIKVLSKIIDNKIGLGLPIDSSIADEFQRVTKHFNFLYGKAIDGIYEFFMFDNKIKNSFSKPIFKILNSSPFFKKYSNLFSDRGFNI